MGPFRVILFTGEQAQYFVADLCNKIIQKRSESVVLFSKIFFSLVLFYYVSDHIAFQMKA